ncbi:MAG TPA: hypothetical protein PKD53_32175 [Chloroflexaceae bacterium]|nr:hypothetical protein [Chloroflexaceae bacterium]
MRRQHDRQARGRRSGRLGRVAGGIGGLALAVTIMMPWGQSAAAATTPRAHNRTFADEAGYTATITEYLAIRALGLDTVADHSGSSDVVRRPSGPR